MSKGNDAAERYLEAPLSVAKAYTGPDRCRTGRNVRGDFIRAHALMVLCGPRLQGLAAGGSRRRGHEVHSEEQRQAASVPVE
jgi:hypothetical protein